MKKLDIIIPVLCALISIIVLLVYLLVCTYDLGYCSGQIDCLQGRTVVQLKDRPDGTRYWAATQPVPSHPSNQKVEFEK